MKRKLRTKLLTAILALACFGCCATIPVACAEPVEPQDPTEAPTNEEVKTPLLKITADNANAVFNNDRDVTAEGFVAYEDFESEALDAATNGYTGNAIKFTQSMPHTNGDFRFHMPTLTDAEKIELKATYTHVRFWLAMRIAYGGWGTFSSGLLKDADGYGQELLDGSGKWRCVTMPIEDFFTAVEGKATPTLLRSYASEDDRVYYFGDIELIYIEPDEEQ